MLYKREKYLKKIRPFYESDDIIKVITGVRRCRSVGIGKVDHQKFGLSVWFGRYFRS